MDEKELWEKEIDFPRDKKNDRGYRFQDTYQARAKLKKDVKEDVKEGKELWMSRPEPNDFPFPVFCGYVCAENRKLREELGWVHNATKRGTRYTRRRWLP